ncbi:MAG: hypothetical protein QM723_07035 [Myxococcaceae bacterium]
MQLTIPIGCDNAAGNIQRAGTEGIGLRLVPAVPGPNDAGDLNIGLLPASFPIRARIYFRRSGAQVVFIPNSDAIFFDEEFTNFDLLDLNQNDAVQVQVFRTRDEDVRPSGSKTRCVSRLVAANTAVPNASPALATDGFRVRPGEQFLNFYFAGFGAGETVEIWVRSVAGNWYATGDVMTPAADGAVQVRQITVPGDRVALKASVGGRTYECDCAIEVG